MIQPLFPPPHFCKLVNNMEKMKWVKVLYLVLSIISSHFVLVLLFIFWKSVNNNQPLFHLAPSYFFSISSILYTLLNYLYYCYLTLDSKKKINSGCTQCIKIFVLLNAMYDMGCVSQTKMVFHCICNNIKSI